ncbi:MAG TPA: hypothetical protein VN654_05365 [Vicinamibacterales bacterium]|nr:hypothetical protein [Vicinamibacterales bacterium]
MTDQPSPSAVPIAPQEAELLSRLGNAVSMMDYIFRGQQKIEKLRSDTEKTDDMQFRDHADRAFDLLRQLRAARLPSEARPSPTDPRIAEIRQQLSFGGHISRNQACYLLQRLEQVTKERDEAQATSADLRHMLVMQDMAYSDDKKHANEAAEATIARLRTQIVQFDDKLIEFQDGTQVRSNSKNERLEVNTIRKTLNVVRNELKPILAALASSEGTERQPSKVQTSAQER